MSVWTLVSMVQGKLEDGLPAARPLSVETDLSVHHLSFLEKTRYYKHFVGSLPFGSAASIVFWSLFFNQGRAIKIAMKCAPAVYLCLTSLPSARGT